MPTPDHLSYSSISTYNACGRSWYYRYVVKMQVPVSSNLVFGSAFHNAVETYLECKASGAEHDLTTLWHAAWNTQRDKNADILFADSTPDELVALGEKMATSAEIIAVLDALKPAVDPHGDAIQTEVPVTLTLPDLPPVIGYVDVITTDGIPADFKTAARAWPDGKADSELQPTFYLAALTQCRPDLPNRAFRYYVFTKTKVPKVQVIETTRQPWQMFWLMTAIAETWHAIQAGVFPPTGVGSWKCTPEYCDYWQYCQK